MALCWRLTNTAAPRVDPPADPFVQAPQSLVRQPGRGLPKQVALDSTRPTPRMRAHVHSSVGTQSIASATPTVVTFNTVDFDNVGLFTASRFTIPTTGKVTEAWLVQGRTIFAAAAGGTARELTLRKNGTTTVSFAAAPPNTLTTLCVSLVVNDPAPGDFYELVVNQDSGAPLNITTTADKTFLECIHLW